MTYRIISNLCNIMQLLSCLSKRMKGRERMKTKFAVIASIVLTALIVSLAFAAFYLNRPLNITGTVTPHNDLQIYSDVDCTIVISTLSYGNLYRGSSTPQTFYIKNIGEQALQVAWNVTGAPTGFSFTMNMGPNGLTAPDTSNSLAAGIEWTLVFTVTLSGSASFAPFSFNCNIYGTA